jgi:hypothetical protein
MAFIGRTSVQARPRSTASRPSGLSRTRAPTTRRSSLSCMGTGTTNVRRRRARRSLPWTRFPCLC